MPECLATPASRPTNARRPRPCINTSPALARQCVFRKSEIEMKAFLNYDWLFFGGGFQYSLEYLIDKCIHLLSKASKTKETKILPTNITHKIEQIKTQHNKHNQQVKQNRTHNNKHKHNKKTQTTNNTHKNKDNKHKHKQQKHNKSFVELRPALA